jgi:hypothetical protein
MANRSEFSVFAYQRQPGYWRAAVTRKDGIPLKMSGDTLKSFITPNDCQSEEEALKEAEVAIRNI